MKVSPLFIITIFKLVLLVSVPFAAYGIVNSPAETTLAYFRQVPCLEEDSYHYHKDIVRNLSYTRMRAFRAFCSLPDISAAEAIEALQRLVFYPLSFDQVEILETFFTIDTATFEQGWNILEKTAGLKFTAIQAASALSRIAALDTETFFSILNTLLTLDDSGCWAAKALFNVQSIEGPEAAAGLTVIKVMSAAQHISAEKGTIALAKNLNSSLSSWRRSDSCPRRMHIIWPPCFQQSRRTPQSSLFWLHNYFALPVEQRGISLLRTFRAKEIDSFSGCLLRRFGLPDLETQQSAQRHR